MVNIERKKFQVCDRKKKDFVEKEANDLMQFKNLTDKLVIQLAFGN